VPAILTEANDPTRRYWARLPGISAPTLLIGGGPDSYLPPEELAEVARLIPDSTLVTIRAGHHVHATDPEAFCDAVLPWLLADA
jgi:3-oxoadipate enol-lactonase